MCIYGDGGWGATWISGADGPLREESRRKLCHIGACVAVLAKTLTREAGRWEGA